MKYQGKRQHNVRYMIECRRLKEGRSAYTVEGCVLVCRNVCLGLVCLGLLCVCVWCVSVCANVCVCCMHASV